MTNDSNLINDGEQPKHLIPYWKKDWLDEILKKIDLTRMSPEQRVMFDMSLVKEVMYHQKLEDVARDAAKEAADKTKSDINKTVVIKGWLKGYPIDELAELTDLSIPDVENIIQQYKSVQQV
jgi:hypothetical protein